MGIGIGSAWPPHQTAEGILRTNPIFASLGVEAIVGQELLRIHRQLRRLDAQAPRLELW